MMKLFLWIIGLAFVGAVVYAYMMGSGSLPPLPLESINTAIDRALLSAPLDASEFDVGRVMFKDGEAAFAYDTDRGGGGYATLGKPRAVAVKGEDADVFATVDMNGGGTGIFSYLVHYEYSGATKTLVEAQKIFLGDRIAVDNIRVEFTAPRVYQVLVSLRDRKSDEPMAAGPSEPRVWQFTPKEKRLELTALTFGTIDDHDVILLGPFPGDEIETTFTVTGAARGSWYFEASFPVQLKTLDGDVLASTAAQAQGNWQTTELVPFTATIVAPSTAKGPHMLVIKKDNPSGLPKNEKEYEIPVMLK